MVPYTEVIRGSTAAQGARNTPLGDCMEPQSSAPLGHIHKTPPQSPRSGRAARQLDGLLVHALAGAHLAADRLTSTGASASHRLDDGLALRLMSTAVSVAHGCAAHAALELQRAIS